MIAIDVGTNVMHKSLRENAKVELFENTNITDVGHEKFESLDLIVVDVSFVSLSKIIDKVASENVYVEMMCLIKPQFECGKNVATKYGGVIKSKTIHKEVLNNVISFFNKSEFYLLGLDFSPIKGGDGNIEYVGAFSKDESKVINKYQINNCFKLMKGKK